MVDLPHSVQPSLRRLRRRLAIGLFLDVWPPWAAAGLLLAAGVALGVRVFYAPAAAWLPWLWLAPVAAAVPAGIVAIRRAYEPGQVVALADALAGGRGLLLTLFERGDESWWGSALLRETSSVPLPRLRPWRRLVLVVPALACLAAAWFVPQRMPRPDPRAALAGHLTSDLVAAVMELKRHDVLTPDEERRIDEEIERVRRDALERMDASSWEAADALKERIAQSLADKRDALAWAQESLARYAAAAQAGGDPRTGAAAGAEAEELARALGELAASGQLAGAPGELQQLASGGASFPADAESIRRLSASLAEFLGERSDRFASAAALAGAVGRFDPSEFPLEFNESGPDGDGDPGTGGINRGRGDAELTLGSKTLPFDRFKAQALPPGFVRSPDDWAPVVVLPGAPQEAAERGRSAGARAYDPTTGQTAWRRTLAPRHQSAVKKYFEQ